MSILFQILMNFFVDIFGKIYLHAAFKISITVLFIGLLVSAIYAYVKSYSSIVSSLSSTVPDIVSGVWGWVMPSNTNLCIFAIVSSILLRFVTAQYIKFMNYRFKAAISN